MPRPRQRRPNPTAAGGVSLSAGVGAVANSAAGAPAARMAGMPSRCSRNQVSKKGSKSAPTSVRVSAPIARSNVSDAVFCTVRITKKNPMTIVMTM